MRYANSQEPASSLTEKSKELPKGWEGNPDGGENTPSPYAEPYTTKMPRLHPYLLRHTRCKGTVADHSDPEGECACKCYTCLEIIDEAHGNMVESPPYLVRYGVLGDMGINLGACHARSLRVSDSTPEPGILAHPCRRSRKHQSTSRLPLQQLGTSANPARGALRPQPFVDLRTT